jgi:Protein of unknown function (DUF3592)
VSRKQEMGYPTVIPSSSPPNGIFEAVFGVAALLIFGYCMMMLYNGWRSYDWKNTQGQVISSKTVSEEDTSGKISSRRTVYKPQVSFTYVVGSQTLTSSDIHPPLNDSGTLFNGAMQTEATLQKYPKGSQVVVYYDPQEPGQACLEPGVNVATFAILFGFFILCAIVPLWPVIGRLQEMISPTKPAFVTKTEGGRRAYLSSFREEQDSEDPPKKD